MNYMSGPFILSWAPCLMAGLLSARCHPPPPLNLQTRNETVLKQFYNFILKSEVCCNL